MVAKERQIVIDQLYIYIFLEKFPLTEKTMDMFPVTGDIHSTALWHVETVCLMSRKEK